MKNILLTGIGGFIGSHIVDEILANTDWNIIGIASWRHKGMPQRILDSTYYQNNKDRVKIITHDLNAPLNHSHIKEIGHVDYLINCASESHVDRSIAEPESFVLNNVKLVLNILNYARDYENTYTTPIEKIIQVSTDEVYGDAPEGMSHKEWSSIRPSNPYSASKAAQEAIAFSYWRTYSLPIMITNTMNNVGERQDAEKFFPMLIKHALTGEKTYIHANADKSKAGTRFYLHARNHAHAIRWLLENQEPQMYPNFNEPVKVNLVGDVEIDNLTFANMVYDLVKEIKPDIPPINVEMVSFHASRPGHDLRYALDGTKLKEMGYSYPVNFEQSIRKSIEWYLNNPKWLGL